MQNVNWGPIVQVVKRTQVDVNDKYRNWCDVIQPMYEKNLIGNTYAIKSIDSWFSKYKSNGKSGMLFVHGESGTGKSTSVDILSKKHGFQSIHTFADQQRTPAKLEGIIRQASMFKNKGLVILDDFEIFLSETTSLRVLSKFMRDLIYKVNVSSRVLFVIISNNTDSVFSPLQDLSTVVNFEPLTANDMFKVFRRLTLKVRGSSYVPPMAAYFASRTCPGNITQGVQQLQFMYGNLKEPKRRSKKRKASKISLITKIERDPVTYLWAEMYSSKMFEQFVSGKFTMDKIYNRFSEFGKDRLDIIGQQVYTEYLSRFKSSSVDSLDRMWKCIDSMSKSDIHRPEVLEDGLYTSENKDNWSSVDLNYVCSISDSLSYILNTRVSEFPRKVNKTKFRTRKYVEKYKSTDGPSSTSYFTDDMFYKGLILSKI